MHRQQQQQWGWIEVINVGSFAALAELAPRGVSTATTANSSPTPDAPPSGTCSPEM
jgi:hypothetical protein